MKIETLKVEDRPSRGKLANRRLRADGKLPVILYGHGEEAVSLAVSRDALGLTLRHHARVVELEGAAIGQALLQELQWDTFGREVLHVDLLRVAKGEKVTVEVEVKGKGEAPGEADGGVVEQVRHTVEIEVSPAELPDELHVNLAGLKLGGTITAAKIIDMPESATLISDKNEVLFTCNAPSAMPETTEEVATGAEPELVRDRKSDEDADE